MAYDFDLTVLVPPALGTTNPIKRAIRAARMWRHGVDVPRLGGHYGVTRSLCAGLAAIGAIRWRIVTKLDAQSSKAVAVLAGKEQLADAVASKNAGRCERILAGPNMVMWPEQEPLLASSAVDVVVVPSQWVLDAYEVHQPGIGAKCAVWAAGVDTDYWKPTRSNRTAVTVYNKGRDADARSVEIALQAAGYQTHTLSYGSYRSKQYRAVLDQSFACVVVGQSESQGLAIAEAWAMDVPTVVARFDMLGPTPCSAAPYLGAETGEFFDTADDVALAVERVRHLTPREWIMRHQTDAASARHFLVLAGLIAS